MVMFEIPPRAEFYRYFLGICCAEVEEQGLAGAEIDNIQESGIWRNEKYVMSRGLLRNIEKF